jgi:hypothetical protein
MVSDPGLVPIMNLATIVDLATITGQENPIHETSYSKPGRQLNLGCVPLTLQHHAAQNDTQHFEKAFITKISDKNNEGHAK